MPAEDFKSAHEFYGQDNDCVESLCYSKAKIPYLKTEHYGNVLDEIQIGQNCDARIHDVAQVSIASNSDFKAYNMLQSHA